MSSVAAPSTASRLAPALADGIAVSMREDPRVYVWGEDVRIGVMGPTRGLVDEFGPDRVIDCPISEAAFVGAAIGAAVGGLRPVVDIMFSSFAYVAFDQLVNQAGRLRYMTGGQLRLPLVVVGSAGAAGANAAQHSELPSALFLQAGGLRSSSRLPRIKRSGSRGRPSAATIRSSSSTILRSAQRAGRSSPSPFLWVTRSSLPQEPMCP